MSDINMFISKLNAIKKNDIVNILDTNIKYDNTFVIDNSKFQQTLDYTELIKILTDLGLKRSYNNKKNHVFGVLGETFYNTNIYLTHGCQFIKTFKNKYTLYFNLQFFFSEYYKKVYPQSFLLTSDTKLLDDIIYIARPIDGFAGADITIVYDNKTLEKAKSYLNKKEYKTGVSLTRYITNPLLFNGKNFIYVVI